MKRGYWLLIIGMLFSVLSLTGCGQQVTMEEKILEQSEEQPLEGSFYVCTSENITYQFEKKTYTRDESLKLYETMNQLKEKAATYLGVEPKAKATICVVEETPLGGSYALGQTFYSTRDDWEKGRCDEWYIQAIYGIRKPWVAVGIANNSSLKGVSTEDLSTYYSESEDFSDLALFGARFIKSMNYKEDYAICASTASQLVDYALKNYGVEKLLAGEISVKEKNAWLKSIGVTKEYPEYLEEIFGSAEYEKSKDCALVVKCGNATFELILNSVFKSAKELQRLIEAEYYFRMEGKTLCESNLASDSQNVERKYHYCILDEKTPPDWDQPNYETGEMRITSYGWTIARKVNAYEMLMLANEESDWKIWAYSELFYYMSKEYSDVAGKGFIQFCIDRYQEHADGGNEVIKKYLMLTDGGKGEINVRLYLDLKALDSRGKEDSIKSDFRLNSHAGVEEQLTFSEYVSYIAYISEKYGEDAIKQHLLKNVPFSDLVGKSDNILIVEWRKYLKYLEE